MRRRLIRSTFLFATTWGVMVGVGPWLPSQGHIVAQDRDHATIASTRSDAYLLGLVGTAHVLVVHDYLGALVEQGQSAAARPQVLGKLDGLNTHCSRLVAEFQSREEEDGPISELASLSMLLQLECAAARSYVARPSAETFADFQTAQSTLARRIKQLNKAPSATPPSGSGAQR